MSNDELLYSVYNAVNQGNERLDNIEKSVYMFLTQNMIDEYSYAEYHSPFLLL